MKNYRLYYHEPFKKVVQSRYLTEVEEEKFVQSNNGVVDIAYQFKYYPYTILGIVELKPIVNKLYVAHWWSSPYELPYSEECISLKEAIKYATGIKAKTSDYPLGI